MLSFFFFFPVKLFFLVMLRCSTLKNSKYQLGTKLFCKEFHWNIYVNCYLLENIFTERFSFILFGINLIFIPIKLSRVQAVTRKINGQKEEKTDQGSDAGSSLKERLYSRKTGTKMKKIKQNHQN